MFRRIAFGLAAAVSALTMGACEDVTGGGGIQVKATGVVLGVAYVDRNGNSLFDQGFDTFIGNITVRLLPPSGGASTINGVTNAQGTFRLANVPVGQYELRVDESTVPDSLRFVGIDSTRIHVVRDDSLYIEVELSYPKLLVRDARSAAPGKRVLLEGVTLNSFAAFGDSTLHVNDSTGSIRAVRVIPANVTQTQKVRLLGLTGVHNGQPAIVEATAFPLANPVTAPTPVATTTGAAANASTGTLDAMVVQVTGAVIVGSQTNAALDVVLTVNDGSGPLDVVVDRQTNIATTSFVPGATLNATGVLVPTATAGVWQLKPRTANDLSATFATVTVAEARALPAGRVVTLEGVALNSWFSFADSTVHLNDATGSIRAMRVTPVNLFTGDRIRLLGTLTLRDGQMVLINVTPNVLGPGVAPLPEVLVTATAATADGGRLDAGLVKVTGATISATSTVSGDVTLTVSDGSGPLEIVLDRDIGFATAPYVVGAVIDVTGVLVVKTGGGEWRLKPRAPADVIVR